MLPWTYPVPNKGRVRSWVRAQVQAVVDAYPVTAYPVAKSLFIHPHKGEQERQIRAEIRVRLPAELCVDRRTEIQQRSSGSLDNTYGDLVFI